MDYSVLNNKQIGQRYSSLPDQVRDVLDSPDAMSTTRRIARFHNLDTERVEMLQQLAGMVLLGYISVEELPREIGEYLHLNFLHSNAITKELYAEIFEEVAGDLKKIYSPLEGDAGDASEDVGDEGVIVGDKVVKKKGAGAEEGTVKIKKGEESEDAKNDAATQVPIHTAVAPKKKTKLPVTAARISDPAVAVPLAAHGADPSDSKRDGPSDAHLPPSKDAKPLMVYEEKRGRTSSRAAKLTKKRFSMPFGFFGKGAGSSSPASPQAVTATIGGEAAAPRASRPSRDSKLPRPRSSGGGILGTITKKRQKRVVHYSDARTAISPFARDDADIFPNAEEKGAPPIPPPAPTRTARAPAKSVLHPAPPASHPTPPPAPRPNTPPPKPGAVSVAAAHRKDKDTKKPPRKSMFSWPSDAASPAPASANNVSPKVAGNTVYLK